jgi:hypothetical protein
LGGMETNSSSFTSDYDELLDKLIEVANRA